MQNAAIWGNNEVATQVKTYSEAKQVHNPYSIPGQLFFELVSPHRQG